MCWKIGTVLKTVTHLFGRSEYSTWKNKAEGGTGKTAGASQLPVVTIRLRADHIMSAAAVRVLILTS